MRRIRTKACLYCWGANRDGSDLDKELTEKKLPRQYRETNSTQGLRHLYEHELVERELLTFGRCISRAGARGVREAVRNKRKTDLEAKYECLLKEHEESYGQVAEEDGNEQGGEVPEDGYGLPECYPARVNSAGQEDSTDQNRISGHENAAHDEFGVREENFEEEIAVPM